MSIKHVLSAVIIAGIWCQTHGATTTAPVADKYDGCTIGKTATYQCVGLPAGCIATKTCVIVAKAQPRTTPTAGAQFEVYWTRATDSHDSWVGVGLSDDRKMGDDSVTEFIIQKDGTTVKAGQGLTFCNPDPVTTTLKPPSHSNMVCGVKDVDSKGITVTSGLYQDGVLTGKWGRDEDIKYDALDFNIKDKSYYILLAYGPVDAQGKITKHHEAIISDTPLSLEANPGTITAAPTPVPTTAPSAAPTTPHINTTTHSSCAPTSVSILLAIFITIFIVFNN